MTIVGEGVPIPGKDQSEAHDPAYDFSLSAALNYLAGDESRERISIRDIFQAMGDRAFGALMLIFALPNCFPTPPGTSAILGAPLVFLTAQLAFGLSPWLPAFIADRSMARKDFSAIASRMTPWLAWAERMLKPRFTFLVHPPVENLLGFFCLVLAIILALPVPLGNILPAIAICLFSFAILERDGLVALMGLGVAIASLFVVAGVIYALFKALIFFITNVLI